MIALMRALSDGLSSFVLGIIVCKSDRKIVYCNEMFCKITGFAEAELLGRSGPEVLLDLAQAPMRSDLAQGITNALDRGGHYYAEFGIQSRDGASRWIDLNIAPQNSSAGAPAFITGVIHDASERKAAEARLRKLEDDYRFIVENVSSGIVIHGPDTEILYANPAARALLGVEAEEIKGVRNSDARWAVVDETEQPLPLDQFPINRSIAEQKVIKQILGNRRESDGRLLWFDCTASPVLNEEGRLEKVLASFADITSLKEAEQRARMDRDRYRSTLALLQDSESRFKIAASTVSDVIWERNLDTGEYWITENWPEKLGLQIAMSPSEGTFNLTGVIEPDKLREAYEAVLASDATRWSIEYEMSDDIGQTVSVALEAAISRKSDGTAHRVIGSLRNVSADKRQREGFTRARALEAVGQLTGGVAHDFNNLLMIISGNAELLDLSELSDGDRQSLELIKSATRSAARLTQRLLSFSGQRRLGPERIDLSDLLQRSADLVLSGFTEAYSIGVHVPQDVWSVFVDPFELEQAIVNLCLNSRDAMEPGGTITIVCENRTFDEETARTFSDCLPGEFVAVTVTDAGRGIPKPVLGRVFDPFFTTKELGKGTGLGLSTVYGFVKQSGGRMSIYSEEGLGTSVTMYFPRAAEAQERTGTSEALGHLVQREGGGKVRILIVEDHPQVRLQAERVLERLGYETRTAHDGKAALAIIEAGHRFDLLFTDVIMPGGMNGKQLADEIKRRSPEVRVLFTSGYPAAAFDQLGIEEIRETFLLRKPYRIAELEAAIARIIGPH
ncbi:MAG: PAS domain S-box protein [Erythrobacter sp.]|nr:PAS domain S-box protein [Erythrobacter sp.]